ncbi:MAG: hypothetical protein WC679_02685 [Bacteroidales bacterium]|jgi:hypothetical protein
MVDIYEKLLQWYSDKKNLFSDKDLMDLEKIKFITDVSSDNDFVLTVIGEKYIIDFLK